MEDIDGIEALIRVQGRFDDPQMPASEIYDDAPRSAPSGPTYGDAFSIAVALLLVGVVGFFFWITIFPGDSDDD